MVDFQRYLTYCLYLVYTFKRLIWVNLWNRRRRTDVLKTKKFVRGGHDYVDFYNPEGALKRLINATTHEEIPSGSQTFKRLANNNRGGKFKPVEGTEEYIVVLAYKKGVGGY